MKPGWFCMFQLIKKHYSHLMSETKRMMYANIYNLRCCAPMHNFVRPDAWQFTRIYKGFVKPWLICHLKEILHDNTFLPLRRIAVSSTRSSLEFSLFMVFATKIRPPYKCLPFFPQNFHFRANCYTATYLFFVFPSMFMALEFFYLNQC